MSLRPIVVYVDYTDLRAYADRFRESVDSTLTPDKFFDLCAKLHSEAGRRSAAAVRRAIKSIAEQENIQLPVNFKWGAE